MRTGRTVGTVLVFCNKNGRPSFHGEESPLLGGDSDHQHYYDVLRVFGSCLAQRTTTESKLFALNANQRQSTGHHVNSEMFIRVATAKYSQADASHIIKKQGTAAKNDPARFVQFGHGHVLKRPFFTKFSFLTVWIMFCYIQLFTRDKTGEMESPRAKNRKCTNFVRTRVLQVSWVYSFGTLQAKTACANKLFLLPHRNWELRTHSSTRFASRCRRPSRVVNFTRPCAYER